MSFIEVNNLWKQFDDKVVLEGVNLTVEQNEFVSIVGASGCGKTTFLNMLLGEIAPSRGQIKIDGVPLVTEPTVERGVVFQRYSVFPHLTVLENVRLGLELGSSRLLGRTFGKRRREQTDRTRAMLERVGLGGVSDAYPTALSGGMQQRLAFAQALMTSPRVLLLDEPFGALDPGIRADMHELVMELFHDLKLTVFMVTHDLQEGFKLGTRLLVFDKTRVDPHEPDLYGASITFDLPVASDAPDASNDEYAEIERSVS